MLFLACWHRNAQIVSTLLDAGADVNKADQRGWSPLIIAAYHNYADIVERLIEAGAEVLHEDCVRLM